MNENNEHYRFDVNSQYGPPEWIKTIYNPKPEDWLNQTCFELTEEEKEEMRGNEKEGRWSSFRGALKRFWWGI